MNRYIYIYTYVTTVIHICKTSTTANVERSYFSILLLILIDTGTSMIHKMSTSTLCLLLFLRLFMINNTLRNIANSNASNSIITPSTTTILETSMINAAIPSVITNTGIHRCGTVVTTITITVVVTITTITMIPSSTIMIIITSARLFLLLLLTVFKILV